MIIMLALWTGTCLAAAPGQDASYPQCGQSLAPAAYSVIGINGGLASRANPCFGLEYAQARSPQLYVNSGNPGSVLAKAKDHGTWPQDNRDIVGAMIPSGYGSCRGEDSKACAYVYGYRMAERDIADAVAGGVADPARLRWWVDIEMFNSWETDSADGQTRDVADLEGMVAGLESPHRGLASSLPLAVTDYTGAPPSSLGLYSTNLQWQQITGGQISRASDLAGLAQWQAGASTASDAQAACSNRPFAGTNGTVWMTQFTDGRHDGDVGCR